MTVVLRRNGVIALTLSIPAGQHSVTGIPEPAAFAEGDYWTVDITAVGPSAPGEDLTVQLTEA